MNKHEYNKNKKDELVKLLTKFQNGEVQLDELANMVVMKTPTINTPYFRATKSQATALYGIKREPIVMYKPQWMRLSKVFSGGKDCTFNKYFFNTPTF